MKVAAEVAELLEARVHLRVEARVLREQTAEQPERGSAGVGVEGAAEGRREKCDGAPAEMAGSPRENPGWVHSSVPMVPKGESGGAGHEKSA